MPQRSGSWLRGVVDRFDGLRHHSVISGNDQNDDMVTCAPRAHGGKRGMAGYPGT